VQQHPPDRRRQGEQSGHAQLFRGDGRGEPVLTMPAARPRGGDSIRAAKHAGDHLPHLGRHLGGPAGRVHGPRKGGFPGGEDLLSDGGPRVARVVVTPVTGELQSVLGAVRSGLFTTALKQGTHPGRIGSGHAGKSRQSPIPTETVEHGLHLVVGRVSEHYAVALLFGRHSQGGLPPGVASGFLHVAGRLVDRAVDHRHGHSQPPAGPHHQGLVVVALRAAKMMIDVEGMQGDRAGPAGRTGREQVEQRQ
jgi:hypothetical protein